MINKAIHKSTNKSSNGIKYRVYQYRGHSYQVEMGGNAYEQKQHDQAQAAIDDLVDNPKRNKCLDMYFNRFT